MRQARVAVLPLLAAVAGATAVQSGGTAAAGAALDPDRKGASTLVRKEATVDRQHSETPPASLLSMEQQAGSHSTLQVHAAAEQGRFKVDANVSWAQLAAWASGNGGFLAADAFKAATTHHAETLIRGMVASRDLQNETELLHVPQKMWLHVDNYPELRDVALASLPECAGKSRPSTDLIKLATVIAIELHKGSSSWYARYLRQLPTMAYYRTFHLHYATEDILTSAFSAMPLVPLVRHMQKADQELKTCFLAWQKNAEKVGGPLELPSLRWDQVELALMHARTRAVSVGKSRRFAVVPGLDFFNTGDAVANKNVRWTVSDSGDAVDVHTTGPVNAKAELLDSYCEECDNSRLMLLWGITLDNNRNSLDPSANRAFCSTSPAGSVGSSDMAVALKDLVASLLDVGEARPKCLALQKPPKEAAKMQAPMRCNLAMLALEYCASTWAAEMKLEQDVNMGRGEFVEMSKEPLFSGMTMREAADTVYASAIGAVHPFLLKAS